MFTFSLGSKKDSGPESEEVRALTNQFFVTLRAYAADLPDMQPLPAGRQKLEALLEKAPADQTWADAYQIEQLLVQFFRDQFVDMELQRRVLEAGTALSPEIAGHYKEQAKAAPDMAVKRALLLRLVNDLQWRYTVNEAKRGYMKEITKTNSWFFTWALILVTITATAIMFVYGTDSTHDASANVPLFSNSFALFMAGLAGGWGAMFSVLIGLKSRLHECGFDDLKLSRSKAVLAVRPLIGVGAALILYFFLQSGLLSGEAFPKITGATLLSTKDLAMLVVWCFVAGFSEKLVPDLLARTESRASAETPVTPGSPRPNPAS